MQAGDRSNHDEVRSANRLYWETDEGVNQIADRLGISKGRLYGLLEPRPAGVPCPLCGGALAYANRTARDRGFAVCEGCEAETEIENVSAETSSGSGSGGGRASRGRASPAADDARGPFPPLAEAIRPTDGILMGALLVGAAAGWYLIRRWRG